MNKEFPGLYSHSCAEAKHAGELVLWRDSQKQNIACKEAIEVAIKQNFDGYSLAPSCCSEILSQYGFKRVQYVLAATLLDKSYDGRFDSSNMAWARVRNIPADSHNHDFSVQSHPAILNGFIHAVRDAYNALHLFSGEDCNSLNQDLKGQVLVVKPELLKESYWTPESQLWLAEGGFGCSPTSSGRAVYATCLGDGEKHVRWNRGDFLGVLKDELLPDWARKQLDILKSSQEIGPIDSDATQVVHL